MSTTVTWKAQAVNRILSRGNIYHTPIKTPLTSIRVVSFNQIRLITDLSSCNGNNPGLTSHMWAPMNDRRQISSCPLTSSLDFSQTPYLPLPPPRLPQYHSPELYLWLPQCPIKTSRQNPTTNQQWQLGNSQRKTTHDIFSHSTYKITLPQCLISLALNCQWPYHHPMILKKKQDIGNTKLLSLKYWGDRIVVQVLCFLPSWYMSSGLWSTLTSSSPCCDWLAIYKEVKLINYRKTDLQNHRFDYREHFTFLKTNKI